MIAPGELIALRMTWLETTTKKEQGAQKNQPKSIRVKALTGKENKFSIKISHC